MFADLKIKLLQVLESISVSHKIKVQCAPFIGGFESEILESKRYKYCIVQNTPFSLQFLVVSRN